MTNAAMDELAPDVAAALAAPTAATAEFTLEAAGIPFRVTTWGDAAKPAVLLLHGVTSNAQTWWRVAPALASTGRRIIAPDMPGHGETGAWAGRHRFTETAQDIARLVAALGLEAPTLSVVGHSWGGLTSAALPSAGLRPAQLVLLDPPTVPLAYIAAMLEDPVERRYDDLAEAIRDVGALYPTWPYGDVHAKALGLTQFDEAAVRAILTENGDWDGGLGALEDPAASGIPVWLIRGDPAAGGYVPNDALPAFTARLGTERIITIHGAPHSPQRTHPEMLVASLLRAMTDQVGAGWPGGARRADPADGTPFVRLAR